MKYFVTLTLVLLAVILAGNAITRAQAVDPKVLTAKAAVGNITVDGNPNESDWQLAVPYLKFGLHPTLLAGEDTVTGGTVVRPVYTDTSYATVKFLRKGMNLFIAVESDDKSVGKFGDSWEGDGLFLKITDRSGHQGEFHLYFNDDSRHGTPRADSAVYETGGGFSPSQGFGVGLVNSGTVPYDTTQVDSGYKLELQVKLDSLGFSSDVDSLTVSVDIFDPDGYPAGSQPWIGPDSRSFFKSWWGSEWGDVTRKLYLEPQRAYDDPPVLTAKSSMGTITVDGKLDESDWMNATPVLKFGDHPSVLAGEESVTGGTLVRGTYFDKSYATLKMLRKGMNLYLGIHSDDKSIGKFGDSWEGDGLFMKITDASGHQGEFHLFYNDDSRHGTAKADSAIYEAGGGFHASQGFGIGLVGVGSVPFDTTQTDSGYTLELQIKLDSLGFTSTVDTLSVSIDIFDPDGYPAGSQPWVGPDTRSFDKTWWGSEWGDVTRKVYLQPERAYDDPASIVAKAALGTITVDGKLTETDWKLATPALKFGYFPPVVAGEKSVTGGVVVRGTYSDQSYPTVKFLRKGMNLYLGVESDDKSVGKFGDSWEGDGLFMKIIDASGHEGEFHLYYNDDSRHGTAKGDSAVYETGGGFRLTQGFGIGLVNLGTVPYDTTQTDNGYTLELQIKLDSLGFTAATESLHVLVDMFNPNGYPAGSQPWIGPDSRSFFKSWWGNEWDPANKIIILGKEAAYQDPQVLTAKQAASPVVVDGKMDEPEWATAIPYLKFGPDAVLGANEMSVTGGTLVRGNYWDPSYATVKFLRRGMNLYLGVQSADNSVGKFGDSWEGDGLFMKITDAFGHQGEFHLFYNDDSRHGTAKADSAVYETSGGFRTGQGYGVGLVGHGSVPYDTTQTDSGYTLELQIKLDSLGFTSSVDTLLVSIDVFDPDGYHFGSPPWVGPDSRSFYKTWWGSEWGDVTRKIHLSPSTGVEQEKGIPMSFTLQQNYPNPFNPATTIQYGIPNQSFVTLKVYNTLGQEVAVLINAQQSAGNYSVSFNASALPSGLFFYRLQAGTFMETKKLMLVK